MSAKHGVVGLMRTLALELAPHFIRVNTARPTTVDTDMVQNEATYRLYLSDLEIPAGSMSRPPGHRCAADPVLESADVSDAVLFLASDEARYITGVTLPVDAGYSLKQALTRRTGTPGAARLQPLRRLQRDSSMARRHRSRLLRAAGLAGAAARPSERTTVTSPQERTQRMGNGWFETVAELNGGRGRQDPRCTGRGSGLGEGRDRRRQYQRLQRARFRAARGRASAQRDLSTTVRPPVSLPVIISPTGVQAVHPDGEVAVARAARNRGTVMGLSSFASKPVEEVVAANPATFFQTYWIGTREDMRRTWSGAAPPGRWG